MSISTTAAEALRVILRARVVPIIRTPSREWAAQVAEVLAEAGLDVIEVTFTVPDAAQVIRSLRSRLPHVLVGAGTVTHSAIAEPAIDAGAAAVGIGTALVGPGTRPVDLAALRARTGALIQALAAL